MRALDCDCGRHLEAANDEKLFDKAKEHVNRHHPEMQLSDEHVREIVAEKAYDKRPDVWAGIDVPPRAAAFMGGGGCPLVARGLSLAKNDRTACRRRRDKKGRRDW